MTPGTIIAHYKITAKLGEGGMGAVNRATDTKLNREVAIKVLPVALACDAQYIRFELEAQMLAALERSQYRDRLWCRAGRAGELVRISWTNFGARSPRTVDRIALRKCGTVRVPTR
jgi:hypothetical protein